MKRKFILAVLLASLLIVISISTALADVHGPMYWTLTDVVCDNGFTSDLMLNPANAGIAQDPESNIVVRAIAIWLIDDETGSEELFYENPGQGFKDPVDCWVTTIHPAFPNWHWHVLWVFMGPDQP